MCSIAKYVTPGFCLLLALWSCIAMQIGGVEARVRRRHLKYKNRVWREAAKMVNVGTSSLIGLFAREHVNNELCG